MLRPLLLAVLLLPAACREGLGPPEKTGPIAGYCDLEELFETQAAMLDSAGAGLYKAAWLDGHRDSAVLRHDFRGWQQELSPLQEAHIRPNNIPLSYRIEREESAGGLLVRFRSLYPDQTAVDSLSILYRGAGGPPVRISATRSESNSLYASCRFLEAEFDSAGLRPMLRRYRLWGWQKMIGMDSVHLGVEAEIR